MPVFWKTGHLTSPRKWYSFYTMEFEFDPKKSAANKEKHGIDFVDAQQLWAEKSLVARILGRSDDEPRAIDIGCLHGKHWSAVITFRGNKIRIISVRRARKEEIEIYENYGKTV